MLFSRGQRAATRTTRRFNKGPEQVFIKEVTKNIEEGGIIVIVREINLASEGRLRLSKKEREEFGDRVIIMKDRNLLRFFSEEEWAQFMQKTLANLKGKKRREVCRFLCSSAFLQEIDKQGKVISLIHWRKKVRQ